MHSSMPVDCHPDIVTMAKPMANGFPLGAILTRDSIAQAMTPGMQCRGFRMSKKT
jgi:acetylornithine aminotransferase